MSYLDHIRTANCYDLDGFRPFIIQERIYGCVRHDFAEYLRHWPEVFQVNEQDLRLSGELADPQTPEPQRTLAVAQVCHALRQKGVIEGWRNELYPVCEGWGKPPVLLLERAAIPYFGVRAYGVHMNGYIGDGAEQKMWISRRSLNKPTGAGKLDQLVAGGQPHGIGLIDNMIKECGEEAGIAPELAKQVRPVGTLSYIVESAAGLRPDVIYIFDLNLPENFQPENIDGEVESFYCWDIPRVMDIVDTSNEFKFNCALVQIDFLIRHGHIPAQHPDYAAICAGLQNFTQGYLDDLFKLRIPGNKHDNRRLHDKLPTLA